VPQTNVCRLQLLVLRLNVSRCVCNYQTYSQVRAIDKVHMLTFVSSNIILFRSSDEQSDPRMNTVFGRIRMYSVRGIIRQCYSYVGFSRFLLYSKNLFCLGLERAGYVWRVTGTFFQKTFFGTARSPLLLISHVNSCQLLPTPRPIKNKDSIRAIHKHYSATSSVLQS
jgi:hypothetical protein